MLEHGARLRALSHLRPLSASGQPHSKGGIVRIPNQAGHVDQHAIFTMRVNKGRFPGPTGPCEGVPFEGPGDLPALIANPLSAPAFCSLVSRGTVAFL